MFDAIAALRARSVPPRTLAVKTTCQDVRLLRRVLAARGYGRKDWADPAKCPDVGSDYDQPLALIVMNYQRANKLAADGVCGPITWASLAAYKDGWPIPAPPQPEGREAQIRAAVAARAARDVGIREATGHNDGEDVERILKRAGGVKGEPYCCAACEVWVEDGYTDCGEAAPIDIGRSCSGLVRIADQDGRLFTDPRQAKPGDLLVLKGGNSKAHYKGVRYKHAGLIERALNAAGKFATIEGNTNSAGSAEGDGVYRKQRSARGCVFVRVV